MKIPGLLCFVFFFTNANSQPTDEMRRVDSLVYAINNASLPFTRDTINQDYPELGLFMKTVVTAVVQNNQLIKYVNYVVTERIENGKLKGMTTSTNFYFDQNKLIKVEDIAIQKGKKQKEDQNKGDLLLHLNWYYDGERYCYPQPVSEKNESRAQLLLTMAKGLVKQIIQNKE